MAKLAVTVTVFFFLFALSHARFPFLVDLNEEDVKSDEQTTLKIESNNKRNTNLIFLPSEKSESKPEEIDTKKPEPSKTATNPFEPVTVINFRPITRQLPRRPSLIFRHRRPCRHHSMRSPWIMGQAGRAGSRSENRVVSYGNDMLTLSDVANKKVVTEKKPELPKWFRNGEQVKMRHIPGRWVHFHDADSDQFPFKIEEVETMMKKDDQDLMRPRHHHHHHYGVEEEEHENVFMKKIRKFLTHF